MNQSLRKKVLSNILEMRGFDRVSSTVLVGASMKGAKNLKHVIIKAKRALVEKKRSDFLQNVKIERIGREMTVAFRGPDGQFRNDFTIGRDYIQFY